MAQYPTYEDGYRRGVEDSAREILENMSLRGITDPLDVINEVPRFLRKKLLSKAFPTGEDLSALIHKICRKAVDEGPESLSETEIQIMGAFALGVNSSVSPVKKITKWVIVLKAGKFTEECVDRGRLWALKSAAEEYVENQIGNSCLGVFPIEIENT